MFEEKQLPIEIKGYLIDAEKLKEFDGKLFSNYAGRFTRALGKFKTNGNYIATITLEAADCYLPVITTYSPDGSLISKETIAIGGCGGDCGFSCEEYMILREDFTFYTSDTIRSFDCDSLGNEIPGTRENYVSFRIGKILKNGKMEKIKEKKLP